VFPAYTMRIVYNSIYLLALAFRTVITRKSQIPRWNALLYDPLAFETIHFLCQFDVAGHQAMCSHKTNASRTIKSQNRSILNCRLYSRKHLNPFLFIVLVSGNYIVFIWKKKNIIIEMHLTKQKQGSSIVKTYYFRQIIYILIFSLIIL